MRTLLGLWTILVILESSAALGSELEAFGGLNSTTYDNSSSANTWGASLRMQYNFSPQEDGWVLNLNAPGISLLAGQLHFGYLWRTRGDFFLEGGAAVGYGAIFGADVALIAGFGYHVTRKCFFDFPASLGSTAISFYPMLGFEL